MIHKKQAILPLLLFSFLVSGWVAIPETEIKALSTENKSKPTSIAATQVENSPELQVPVTTRIVFMYVLSGFDQFGFTISNAKRCSIKELNFLRGCIFTQLHLEHDLEGHSTTVIQVSPFTLFFSQDFRFLSCWNKLDWDSPGASDEEMNLVSLYVMDIASFKTGHCELQFRSQLSSWNPSHNIG